MKILINLKKKHGLNLLNDIRPIAIILTIISVLVCINKNLINSDGILYLKAARAFLESGTYAFLKLYKWPFYPFLIAITTRFLSISLENAAYLWNIVFTIIIVIVFISIIKDINPSISLQFFSMLIIIGHPRLHHWEKYIIRDNGYWAFLLLSIFFIIKYFRFNKWRAFISGCLSLCIAALFRIEGIVLFLLYPLILIIKQESILNRIKKIIFVYGVFLLILGVVMIFCYTKGLDIYSTTRLKEINTYVKSSHKIIATKLHHKGKIAGNVILSRPAKKWGLLFVISGLLGIFIYKLIMTIFPFHLLLAIYSIKNKLIPLDKQIKILIYAALMINLLIPIFFLYNSFFISYRFLMPLSLLILLSTPFALKRIYDNMKTAKNKILRISNGIVILVFLILFIGAFIPPKHSKAYIRDAALWIKFHLPKDSIIYSNAYVRELSYYSEHRVEKLKANKGIKKNNYIILRKKILFNDNSFCKGDLYLLRCFSNKEGKHIYIFKCQ